ncbi:hypothetical protein QZH41_017002 [Actinostola sp. cb2023]|nr:hypothetical protein QZH41_017002 [Actinostola sp. cb2023]
MAGFREWTNDYVRCGLRSGFINNMHEGYQTDLILVMGFGKAFDKVCHRHLITKLTEIWHMWNSKLWLKLSGRSLGGQPLKVATAEGKRWQDELAKFLLAYRTTPQSSTGATPAFLMFGRELRTKLPELRRDESISTEGTRDRDWSNKLAGKMYADIKRGATPNEVTPGDKVLLKNTKNTGKLAPRFEPEPYTVQTKEGQELTLLSKEGVEYRRNSSMIKRKPQQRNRWTPTARTQQETVQKYNQTLNRSGQGEQ